jgi:hypothetical protein
MEGGEGEWGEVRKRPGGALPFYRAPRLHGQRQCLGLKAPVTKVKRGRACDCGQLMMGQVRRGEGLVVGAPWRRCERGGDAHGVGGAPGRRQHERRLGLEK